MRLVALLAPMAFPEGMCPHGATCCDLDDDVLLDLIVANTVPNTVSVRHDLGRRLFALHQRFGTSFRPAAVICANVDGAGGEHLVVGNGNSSFLSVIIKCADFGVSADLTFAVQSALGAWPSGLVQDTFAGFLFQAQTNK